VIQLLIERGRRAARKDIGFSKSWGLPLLSKNYQIRVRQITPPTKTLTYLSDTQKRCGHAKYHELERIQDEQNDRQILIIKLRTIPVMRWYWHRRNRLDQWYDGRPVGWNSGREYKILQQRGHKSKSSLINVCHLKNLLGLTTKDLPHPRILLAAILLPPLCIGRYPLYVWLFYIEYLIGVRLMNR